ncbi:MAG: flagellar filament capping protein FliD [Clostridiales bacterium]|nr:flagellar filament capping protein FliD [Clostridiales bacterium]
MYTNTTRITGLSGSGIDTDAMIEKMMHAESAKLYRYQRNVSWKTWQQDAYRNVIKKFQDFQNKWLSSVGTSTSLKYSTAFASFKNSVKSSKGGDSDAITINKSTSSQKYEIEISQLAQSDTYVSAGTTGKVIKSDANIDLGALANKLTGDGMSFSVTLDGKEKTINLEASDFAGVNLSSMSAADQATAIQDKINEKLKDAFGTESKGQKVSVSLDANGRFSVNENLGHEISIGGAGVSKESYATFSTSASSQAVKESYGNFNVTVNGKTYTVTVDKDDTSSIDAKINSALTKAVDSTGKQVDISGYLAARIDTDGGKDELILAAGSSDVTISNVDSTLSGAVSDATLKSSNDLQNYFNIDYATTKTTNTTTLEDIFDSSLWDADGKASLTINGEKIEFSKDDNLATFLENINSSDAEVKVSYNATNRKFTFESAESGAVNEIKFGGDLSTNRVLESMGFDTSNMAAQRTKAAQDAVVKIDGVETSRTSNNIELDGMEITLNKVTEAGETITIGNETDVDGIYDTIKTFVDEYNTLIEDLNKQVKERRAKSDDYTYYEPLTDQEKKEMDEDEIKLWEEKAKTGLLYRDSTISTILSKMRSAIYTPVTKSDGTKTALYDLGITTSSEYADSGKLVIDETKLKDAIKNNIDDIQAIFTGKGTTSGKGLAENLEGIIESAVGRKGALREKAGIAGTSSVNENTLSKQIKDLNEKISREKEKLISKEQRYYSMFSMMESSIMNSNNQINALFSMMGQ